MLSFKRRIFIIPGIRSSAGQEGIIYYIAYKMRIYYLHLHYVLCRPYVFVLMLTNTADDGKNVILHQQFQVKKDQPSFFNTFVLFTSLKFLNNSHCKFTCNPTHSSRVFVRTSYLKKNTCMCLCQKMQNALHNENIADV